jgi:hypothetical protein
MTVDFDEELVALQRMTLAQLRRRYAEAFGEATPVTNNKAWLVKRIAWRLQALAEGDLSERARRRAAALAQDADLRVTPPRPVQRFTVPAKRRDGLPPAGTVITRPYKGRVLEVKVLRHGFEYQGRVFASLSALAKDITGSHCSGLRFFGLAQQGGQA